MAIAVFAAAGIANAKPVEVGKYALRLGIILFIIPFFFVYQPGLLMTGQLPETILILITATFGTVFLSAGLQGWCFARLNWVERVITVAGGLMMIYPGFLTDGVGLVLGFLVIGRKALREKRKEELLTKHMINK